MEWSDFKAHVWPACADARDALLHLVEDKSDVACMTPAKSLYCAVCSLLAVCADLGASAVDSEGTCAPWTQVQLVYEVRRKEMGYSQDYSQENEVARACLRMLSEIPALLAVLLGAAIRSRIAPSSSRVPSQLCNAAIGQDDTSIHSGCTSTSASSSCQARQRSLIPPVPIVLYKRLFNDFAFAHLQQYHLQPEERQLLMAKHCLDCQLLPHLLLAVQAATKQAAAAALATPAVQAATGAESLGGNSGQHEDTRPWDNEDFPNVLTCLAHLISHWPGAGGILTSKHAACLALPAVELAVQALMAAAGCNHFHSCTFLLGDIFSLADRLVLQVLHCQHKSVAAAEGLQQSPHFLHLMLLLLLKSERARDIQMAQATRRFQQRHFLWQSPEQLHEQLLWQYQQQVMGCAGNASETSVQAKGLLLSDALTCSQQQLVQALLPSLLHWHRQLEAAAAAAGAPGLPISDYQQQVLSLMAWLPGVLLSLLPKSSSSSRKDAPNPSGNDDNEAGGSSEGNSSSKRPINGHVEVCDMLQAASLAAHCWIIISSSDPRAAAAAVAALEVGRSGSACSVARLPESLQLLLQEMIQPGWNGSRCSWYLNNSTDGGGSRGSNSVGVGGSDASSSGRRDLDGSTSGSGSIGLGGGSSSGSGRGSGSSIVPQPFQLVLVLQMLQDAMQVCLSQLGNILSDTAVLQAAVQPMLAGQEAVLRHYMSGTNVKRITRLECDDSSVSITSMLTHLADERKWGQLTAAAAAISAATANATAAAAAGSVPNNTGISVVSASVAAAGVLQSDPGSGAGWVGPGGAAAMQLFSLLLSMEKLTQAATNAEMVEAAEADSQQCEVLDSRGRDAVLHQVGPRRQMTRHVCDKVCTVFSGYLNNTNCSTQGAKVSDLFAAASSSAVLGTVPLQEVTPWLVLLARCLAGEAAWMRHLVDVCSSELLLADMELLLESPVEDFVFVTLEGFFDRMDQLLECIHAVLLACSGIGPTRAVPKAALFPAAACEAGVNAAAPLPQLAAAAGHSQPAGAHSVADDCPEVMQQLRAELQILGGQLRPAAQLAVQVFETVCWMFSCPTTLGDVSWALPYFLGHMEELLAEANAALTAVSGAGSFRQALPELQHTFLMASLPQQLEAFAARLLQLLPVPCCCNNPGCSSTSAASELLLVGGQRCVCARCKVARYCSSSCQAAHWPQHKDTCNAIRPHRCQGKQQQQQDEQEERLQQLSQQQ